MAVGISPDDAAQGTVSPEMRALAAFSYYIKTMPYTPALRVCRCSAPEGEEQQSVT